MPSRRNFLTLFGIAGAATAVPVTALVACAPPATRRVTELPNGGVLIEDQEFKSGIALVNCEHPVIMNCSITGKWDTGVHIASNNTSISGCVFTVADFPPFDRACLKA